LDRIVQKVLSKEPNARYAQADQLGRILINYRDQGLSKTSGQPVVPAAPSPSTPRNAEPAVKSPFASPDSPQYTEPKPPPDLSHAAQTLPGSNQVLEATAPGQYTRPEYMRDSGYFTPVDPPGLDVVTILLAFIAMLAVLGMVILWVFVFQAYT